MSLSPHMVKALQAAPLIRLEGGWWVARSEGIDPRETRGEGYRTVLEGVETHRTVTIKALRDRGYVALTGKSWDAGAVAHRTTDGYHALQEAEQDA